MQFKKLAAWFRKFCWFNGANGDIGELCCCCCPSGNDLELFEVKFDLLEKLGHFKLEVEFKDVELDTGDMGLNLVCNWKRDGVDGCVVETVGVCGDCCDWSCGWPIINLFN